MRGTGFLRRNHPVPVIMPTRYRWDKEAQAWIPVTPKGEQEYDADWTATMKRIQAEKDTKKEER